MRCVNGLLFQTACSCIVSPQKVRFISLRDCAFYCYDLFLPLKRIRRPMAKLSRPERIKRLNRQLDTLRNGDSVSKRDMLALLDPDDRSLFDAIWNDAKAYKQSIIDGRHELAKYNRMLKQADAIWTQYERTIGANKKAETEYAAQSAYERALEHLGELLDCNPTIQIYLDRPVSFTFGSESEPSAETVPRYKLSTSHFAMREEFPDISAIKMQVIEKALKKGLKAAPTATKGTPSTIGNSASQQLRQIARRK